MSWLATLFSGIGTWLLGRLFTRTPPPSRVEVVAAQAAAAEEQLKTEKTNDAALDAAAAARDRADAERLREPEAVRAANRYSRD